MIEAVMQMLRNLEVSIGYTEEMTRDESTELHRRLLELAEEVNENFVKTADDRPGE